MGSQSMSWQLSSESIRAPFRSTPDGTIFRVGLLDLGQTKSKKLSRSTPRVNHS